MAKEEKIKVKGEITEILGKSKFRVELENGHKIIAYPCGKMRKFFIRMLVADMVTVELSSYDLTKGRITYRDK